MDKALVVVISYNNINLTKRAVQALRDQTYDTRFVVWDNDSKDGTPEWLRMEDFEHELSPVNMLWTPAVNAAIAKFWDGEKYIGYMNNDAMPLPSTVERLVSLLERPVIGLVGPSMSRIGGPQEITQCEGYPFVERGGFVDNDIRNLPPKRVNYVMGAFAMLRKEVWDEIGPLDESMPLGADDHDYALRLKEKDYQVWVAQNAFVEHAGHASARVSREAEKTWDDIGAKSWNVFNEKWSGYFATEEEALNCHWGGGIFNEGWTKGTGWS